MLAVPAIAVVLAACGGASGTPSGNGTPAGGETPGATGAPAGAPTPTIGGTIRDGCQLMSRDAARSITGDTAIGAASGIHPNCTYLDQSVTSTSGDHAGVLILPSTGSATTAALEMAVQQNAFFDFPGFANKPFHYQQVPGLGDLAYSFTGSSDGIVFAKGGDTVIVYAGSHSKSDAEVLAAITPIATAAAGEL